MRGEGEKEKGKKTAYRMRKNRVRVLSQPGVAWGDAIVCVCVWCV